MAFTNHWGEVSPEELLVELIVDINTGRVIEIVAENSKLELSKLEHTRPFVRGATEAAPYLSPPLARAQARRSDIEKNILTSLRTREHYFVMLDVGRWGGPAPLSTNAARDFGIVWQTWVALCEFVPYDPKYDNSFVLDSSGNPQQIPVNDVIRQLRGGGYSVKVNKWVLSKNANYRITEDRYAWTPDWKVYVVLPDLHLPVATSRTAIAHASKPVQMPRSCADELKPNVSYNIHAPDGNHWGRHEYRVATVLVNPMLGGRQTLAPDDAGVVSYDASVSGLGAAADRWFTRYLEGDIFGAEKVGAAPGTCAAADLAVFLERVGGLNIPKHPVHFVQVGDMYDYWIGLECFFDDVPAASIDALAPRPDVFLKTNVGVDPHQFIDEWTRRTHACFPELFKRVNALQSKSDLAKSWFWGNHDSYLATHTPSGTPKRIRQIRSAGVFLEHGQRADPDNRDGAESGHKTTNWVFRQKVVRSFDPNRRNYYSASAAVAYAHTPDFGVYVMGHTHSPFLTHVKVKTTAL